MAGGGDTRERSGYVGFAGGKPASVPLPLPAGVDVVVAVISGDRRALVGGSRRGITVVWDLASATPAIAPRTFAKDDFPDFGFFSLGGAVVVTSGDGRWMAVKQVGQPGRLWDLHTSATTQRAVELAGSDSLVPHLAISPNNRWLVSGGHDSGVHLWDLTATDPSAHPRVLRGHTDDLTAIAFSDDSRWLVTGSMDRTARLWDLNAARPETSARVLRGHGDMVRALSISPDGRWLVSSSLVNRLDVNGRPDTTAHLWDMRLANAEATPHELIGHDAGVTAAMLTADGHRVITGSDGGRVRLWDVTAEDPAANPLVLRGPERGIQHLALSADGRWVVALSVDASARVWDLRAPQPSATPLLLQAGTALDFSPDSHWLLTAGGDVGYVSSLASDNPAATSTALPKLSFLNGPPAQVFSADSRWLAVGTEYQAARLIDLASSGQTVRTVDDGGGEIYTLAISPDGRWLITNRKNHSAETRLWNLTAPDTSSGPVILVGNGICNSRAVTGPDSAWLVMDGDDMAVRFWNLAKTDPRVDPIVLPGVMKKISGCAFSPDGQRFVATSDDVIQIWTVEGGHVLPMPARLPGHVANVLGLQFSPDGRWLIGRAPTVHCGCGT